MRKRNWFKTAGVITFAAQLLGGGGLAGAVDKACFPMPTFVSGGDPAFDKLDPNNVTRWTGSSGYGWNSGALSELSYEGAIGSNPEYPVAGHPEIGQKRLLLSFSRQVPLPQIDSVEGMRIGFSYVYADAHAGNVNVSEIIALNFDAGGHSFNATPPACGPSTVGTICANDPNSDPLQFQSVKPTQVTLLQKVNDGTPNPWPLDPGSSGDPTQWVKDHARIWIFSDSSGAATKYYWRMQLALPLRGKTAGVSPDPTAFWSSPSVYLDDAAFSATAAGKNIPPFWLEMITQTTGVAGVTFKHFPDWAEDATAPGRDGTYQIPSTTGWATAEVGSPRDPALISAGDIQCSGTGLTIQASTADNVVWHSDIWNVKAGNNTAGVFNDGGRLYMIDAANHLAANRMAVKVVNTATKAVDKSAIKAHFLVAPYGSQAVASIWSPLTMTGNDFTCGVASPGQTSCTPQPLDVTSTFDSAPTTTGSLTQGNDVEIDMAADWKPSANYVCAVQTTDTPPYSWYYQNAGFGGPGQLCGLAAYKPNSTSGAIPAATGLPGHQCMQVQLSSTSAGVQFATKSAFRNMHQATASLRRETATIDTRGLKKIKNQSYHDIYLYVETHNMPYRVDSGYAPPTYNKAMQVYNRNNYCGGESISRTYYDGGCRPGFDPTVPAPSEEFFSKTMPTFVVNAYADTGAKYTVNGKTVPMLTQLTSFGQFITHDAATEGNVFGWDAGLEPVAGTTFQKVGVDTYRIRIPNDGAGKVVTRVEPLPSKRPTCSGKVDMNILQLLSSIAPLITVSPEDAGEINALINSFQIECVDLKWALDKIVSKDCWGSWTSWVKFLVAQVQTASGCKCN